MWRFIAGFGIIDLLFLVSLGVVIGLVAGSPGAAFANPGVWVLAACGVPLVFTLAIALIGSSFFRRIGAPLADVMAAADAVAEGDLSVRLRQDQPGEMGRLAHSFNRMTSELQRAEQQRRNLSADVAHELRNPLHIIQGNLEGVLDGVYLPTEAHIAATLDETRLLARLVDDLQTLSLAEAGQLPLHLQTISAADLLADSAASFSAAFASAGVALNLNIQGDDSTLQVNADPDRLDQVLSNLLANALRHTPSGGQVTLSTHPISKGVRIEVADNGAGIPPEDLPYIFDRFWRGDRSRSHVDQAGSGLGLSIARQLVKEHQGTIEVESTPGAGTRFLLTFPASGSSHASRFPP
jgi:two-component system OmpR family sensor kinase/two-component system sensor histidine kinase BaeS